jgi:acyl-CoA synthetase (AMP-forming)/AMP-acid ligase II
MTERADIPIGYWPGEDPRNNIISYLDRHQRDFPERAALRWVETADMARWDGDPASPLPHRQVTFDAFTRGIGRVAAGLAALGIRQGDRVVIFLPMGVAMYTAMFAVQRLGAVAVFLDSWARRAHLGASAACVNPTAMISHQAAFELVRTVPEFAAMPYTIIVGPGNDADYSARLEHLFLTPNEAPLAPVASESTALITFTTGSSGAPKGANRTHRFLSAQHRALAQILPYGAGDQDLPAFPIFSLNNLASGVTTVIPTLDLAAPSARDGAALTAQLRHEAITCATLSPSMLGAVSRHCREQRLSLTALQRVVTGGAPVSEDNVRELLAVAPHADVLVFYGSTEVEPMAHIDGRAMLDATGPTDPEIVEQGVNVGHVDANLRYKFIIIVDGPIDLARTPWSMLEVAPGQTGEFVVTGEHVCRDYYNNEEAFRKTKIVDAEGCVWHRTGDLARLDALGSLWIMGRINNVIRRGDACLFPLQAEVILKRLPGVRQAAFLGMPDALLHERAAAVVELAGGHSEASAALTEARRLFARHEIPLDAFYIVEKIPMDPRHHSKVEYRLLRTTLVEMQAKDLLRDD